MMKLANAIVDTTGTAIVMVTPTTNQSWTISHLTVEIVPAATAQSKATIRLEQAFICGSNQGNGDTADGSPIVVAAGQALYITWTGAPPGAVATAMLIYS